MKEAIFLDFYGTVVHEDGEIVQKISQIIFNYYSWNIALKCVFKPAWVEIGAQRWNYYLY